MSDPTRMNPVDPAASHLYALAHAAMATSVAGQSWAWPTIDFSDPEQRRFGDYELLAELGRGGMGVVYRARQRSLDREVALKFIAAGMADSLQVARFMGEARAAARLVHPNIVPVYEVGSVGDVHYFSMPLMEGESLEGRLQRGPMTAAALLDLAIPVCEAVDYAHRLGLLHLDLKPANILIDGRGEPLVADFGLARHVDESGGVAAQEVSGTPAFMAPEQILIQQYRLTAATDLYALGALLYRGLSGTSPHGQGDSEELIRRALAGRIRPLREVAPEVDADLEAVVMHCLELEPKHRYPSVRALMEDLRRVSSGLPVSVRRPGPLERVRRWLAREPRLAVAAGVAFVAIAAGGSIAFAQWREAESARALAVSERDAATAAREAEAVQRLRAQYAAALGARLFVRGSELKDDSAAANEVLAWLDERLPGDEVRQAAVLTDFAAALSDRGSLPPLQSLMVRVVETAGADFRSRVAERLAASGTARGLLHAAMLVWRDEEQDSDLERTGTLLRQALDKDPADPFAWYVASTYCSKEQPRRCPIEGAAARLAALDPGNAQSWILRAVHASGAEAYDAIAEAARQQSYRDYFLGTYQAYADAIRNSGVAVPALLGGPARALAPTQEPAMTIAMIEAQTIPVAPYQRLIELCHPGRDMPDSGTIRASCLRVGELMARSRTGILTENVGGAIVRRLAPGTPLADEMKALRARYVYLIEQYFALTPSQQLSYPIEQALRETAELGELEAYARIVSHYGRPTTPPADWQPKEPTALMLPEEREEYRRQQAASR